MEENSLNDEIKFISEDSSLCLGKTFFLIKFLIRFLINDYETWETFSPSFIEASKKLSLCHFSRNSVDAGENQVYHFHDIKNVILRSSLFRLKWCKLSFNKPLERENLSTLWVILGLKIYINWCVKFFRVKANEEKHSKEKIKFFLLKFHREEEEEKLIAYF